MRQCQFCGAWWPGQMGGRLHDRLPDCGECDCQESGQKEAAPSDSNTESGGG